jgi:hypothetical protein
MVGAIGVDFLEDDFSEICLPEDPNHWLPLLQRTKYKFFIQIIMRSRSIECLVTSQSIPEVRKQRLLRIPRYCLEVSGS